MAHFSFFFSLHKAKKIYEIGTTQQTAEGYGHSPQTFMEDLVLAQLFKKKKKAKWISKNTNANAGPMLMGCLVKYFHRKQAQAINFAITMHVVK